MPIDFNNKSEQSSLLCAYPITFLLFPFLEQEERNNLAASCKELFHHIHYSERKNDYAAIIRNDLFTLAGKFDHKPNDQLKIKDLVSDVYTNMLKKVSGYLPVYVYKHFNELAPSLTHTNELTLAIKSADIVKLWQSLDHPFYIPIALKKIICPCFKDLKELTALADEFPDWYEKNKQRLKDINWTIHKPYIASDWYTKVLSEIFSTDTKKRKIEHP